jgi:cobalt-zinc-cadmium efflux system membrane fusion protein
MFRSPIAAFAVILLAFAVFELPFSAARAHEGHVHGPAAPAVTTTQPRAEASSVQFELLAVAGDHEIVFYLDRFAGNEPVTDALIETETPSGQVKAEPRADGTYRLAAPWLAAGKHNLIVTVVSGSDADVLPLTLEIPASAPPVAAPRARWSDYAIAALPALGAFFVGLLLGAGARRRKAVAVALALVSLTALMPENARAHEGHDHGPAASATANGNSPQRLGDGSVFVPKPAQRLLEIRTGITEMGKYSRALELPGRVIPDPNASGVVQSTLAGRLSPPPKGFPPIGRRVEQGEVLAYVTPPLQTIDLSDIRQKEGELLQQISIVERRVARFEQLLKTEAIARTQLDEARLELKGLLDRRAALERTRLEPEALIAPVAGVIAESAAIAGQLAQANAVIFRIVDPARLWIEALSFEPLRPTEGASATLASGQTVRLSFRGTGFAGRNQSIPVQFAIEGAEGLLWAGQFATVFVRADDPVNGIAVPRSAVVRNSSGQQIVYEHVSAERFMPRPVRVEPLDSERFLVLSGLSPSQRVVIRGAELIDQVR